MVSLIIRFEVQDVMDFTEVQMFVCLDHFCCQRTILLMLMRHIDVCVNCRIDTEVEGGTSSHRFQVSTRSTCTGKYDSIEVISIENTIELSFLDVSFLLSTSYLLFMNIEDTL